MLLVSTSHGDVAMASMDSRYGVVTSGSGEYQVKADYLDTYLIPKKPVDLTPELIRERQRGIPYTKSPFA